MAGPNPLPAAVAVPAPPLSDVSPKPMPVPLAWQAEALWERLVPLLPGLSVEVVASVDSTNSALLARARPGVPDTDTDTDTDTDDAGDSRATGSRAGFDPGLVQRRRSRESRAFDAPARLRRAADLSPCLLVAEQQHGGRGRLGRAWQSQRGASLTFSLSMPFAPRDWSGLSLAVGVALAEALDPQPDPPAGATPPRIGLKWPNDLWLLDAADAVAAAPAGAGRKLGGILIETVSAGTGRLMVLGVGLNVLPFAAQARPGGVSESPAGPGGDAAFSSGLASLQELDPQASAPATLACVAEPLLRAFQQFEREGFAPFAARFAARDLLRGREVVAGSALADASSGGAAALQGTALGVTASGALRLRTAHGEREIVGGEVSVRLRPEAAR